jgi:hypothetical protein
VKKASKRIPESERTVKSKFHETHQSVKAKTHRILLTRKGKVLAIVLGIILVAAILTAIPVTRYAILGKVIRKDVTVSVIDSKTKRPVSEVSVTVGGVSVQTDKDGVATLSAPVNDAGIDIVKQYYETTHQAFVVPVFSAPTDVVVELNAQGRQVLVLITDAITKKPVADVTIDSSGTKAISNESGIATMILPPEEERWSASITRDGYNKVTTELVDNSGDTNEVAMVPMGSIVYLSKATGKINVIRANLDGSGAKVIVRGTGNEGDYNTSLLASRDWRYAALQATRENDESAIYLVDVEKGSLTLIDQIDSDDGELSLVGWSGHNFVYQVSRYNLKDWKSKHTSFKAYNADSRILSVLDDSTAERNGRFDYGYEYFQSPYLLSDELVYLSDWYQGPTAAKKYPILVSLQVSTRTEKVVKKFDGATSAQQKLYGPEDLYLRIGGKGSSKPTFYEYEDGVVKTVSEITDSTFYDQYPTYLISPSGGKAFWYEERDGKNVLLLTDLDTNNSRILSAKSEYLPYAWYGDDDQYVLLSKDGSELYIADANTSIDEPLKITDYHRARAYNGYGYGYGGQ